MIDSEQTKDPALELQKLQTRLARANEIVATIEFDGFSEAEPLRLDVVDPAQFLDNYDRVGLIKARLINHTIPDATAKIQELTDSSQEPLSRPEPSQATSIVRKPRWTEDDIKMFERAEENLIEMAPKIRAELAQFNQANGAGWQTSYDLGSVGNSNRDLRWGVISAVGLQEPTEDEIRLLSDFAANLASDLGLRGGRVFLSKSEYEYLSKKLGGDPYRLNPKFFLKPVFSAFGTAVDQSKEQPSQSDHQQEENSEWENLADQFTEDIKQLELSQLEQKITAELIAGIRKQGGISSSEWADKVWTDSVKTTVKLSRLSNFITHSSAKLSLLDKYSQLGWKLRNTQPRGSKITNYILERQEPEIGLLESAVEVDESEKITDVNSEDDPITEVELETDDQSLVEDPRQPIIDPIKVPDIEPAGPSKRESVRLQRLRQASGKIREITDRLTADRSGFYDGIDMQVFRNQVKQVFGRYIDERRIEQALRNKVIKPTRSSGKDAPILTLEEQATLVYIVFNGFNFVNSDGRNFIMDVAKDSLKDWRQAREKQGRKNGHG